MNNQEWFGGTYGGMKPGVYKDGVLQDEQALAAQSGFIGRNNMGMNVNAAINTNPMKTPLPPIGGTPVIKAGLGIGKPQSTDQNFLNWLQTQNTTTPTSMFGQPLGQQAKSGSMFSDSTGSMRIL